MRAARIHRSISLCEFSRGRIKELRSREEYVIRLDSPSDENPAVIQECRCMARTRAVHGTSGGERTSAHIKQLSLGNGVAVRILSAGDEHLTVLQESCRVI